LQHLNISKLSLLKMNLLPPGIFPSRLNTIQLWTTSNTLIS
jgi:hypothetical protein